MADVTWTALYTDGTSLSQFETGVNQENSYYDIDRTKLEKFVVYRNSIPYIVLHLDKSKKLIFRKRVAMNINSVVREIVWIVGWQEKINGAHNQMILFLFNDGRIEAVDRFKEGTKWMYPIAFTQEESL